MHAQNEDTDIFSHFEEKTIGKYREQARQFIYRTIPLRFPQLPARLSIIYIFPFQINHCISPPAQLRAAYPCRSNMTYGVPDSHEASSKEHWVIASESPAAAATQAL